MSTTATPPENVRVHVSSTSARIIAVAVLLVFCYYAAGVLITVLLSVLLAYCLDPLVDLLERVHLPRRFGALLVVLLLVAIAAGAAYGLWARAENFDQSWPQYRTVLKQAAGAIESKIKRIEGRVSEIAPDAQPRQGTEPRPNPGIVRSVLLRGMGSLYGLLLEATFVPFLVFFMLVGKRDIWHGTLQLFPASRRTQVKETLEDLRDVLRGYLAGMALVTLVVIVFSSLFFWILGLDYPLLTGVVSGLVNMVPYLGAVLAWLPPLLLGLVKWKTMALGHFLLVAGVLSTFHLLAINLLAPALVGRRVQLNAVAITLALLFWGWLWGGMGLILAIPITATFRVICDHTESWKPIGRWLGA